MQKYTTVFLTSFKQESKTLANSLLSASSFAIIIYIFRQLWGYIYSQGLNVVINGYSIQMMIWYLIMAEIVAYAISPRGVTRSISNDIKSGKIAYQLNKPYNYFGYQIASQAGVSVWKLCFLLPTAAILGTALLGVPQGFSLLYVFPLLISIALSVFLSCVMYSVVGLLSFWIEEAAPFTWIIQKFVMLFGLFFPPEFFPSFIATAILYSPVYAIMSGPSKLLAAFSWEMFLQVTLIQALYLGFFVVLGLAVFFRGARKVNIHGG